ncbi:2-oxoglutarate dehydrogenase E1 component [Oecophyllibacter saccharovorans]|uniref:2-oxoglutarate dehydrogenase E1 component n=1 Tax=Oecophyllibacter saccharovorans TaxID=2558360 RepID=UPI001144385D|nr:2-oxoglutarate dehydrogenase E1 component [Oecophyllibacter saccharovorans]QDH14942.1 2-oxoglutarate dehydrogenase E1 component [Oecophyllibacter saccharovorans]
MNKAAAEGTEPQARAQSVQGPDIFSGDNLSYLTALEEQWGAAWHADPAQVPPDVAALLQVMEQGHPPSSVVQSPQGLPEGYGQPSSPTAHTATEMDACAQTLHRHNLREAWRQRGHLRARLDPLRLRPLPELPELTPPDADPSLQARLEQAYGGEIGVEFMHLQDPAQRQWWIDRFESPLSHTSHLAGQTDPLSPRELLSLLTQAEGFEHFCQQRFLGMRRFGLEGGESLIVALQSLIAESLKDGVQSISLGMPHRGRLNVMATVLRKPAEAIFAEFAGKAFQPPGFEVSGDVKYHLGTATTLANDATGTALRLTLLPNPSHLEAVDPVVMGRVRADQDRTQESLERAQAHRSHNTQNRADGGAAPPHEQARQAHLGILVHGDAAFAGQGVVYETLQLSRLPGYGTGGTVHLLVNNQIGFTTGPESAHSGIWNTDVARTVQAPVLHVNGDAPEAVMRAARLAHQWRTEFGSDVVLDILCYRRHGHNETDEPAFTQPAMVQAINAHPTTRQLYARKLENEGLLTAQEAAALWDRTQTRLQKAFDEAADYQPDGTDWLDVGPLDPTRLQDGPERIQPMTGVPLARLREVGQAMTRVPEGVTVHPRLERQLVARRKAVQEGRPIDWATAESLALGTLALDGHPVRLSGQDSQRGTFSQRHAVLNDQHGLGTQTPLAHLSPRQAPVKIWNSPLSEYGVLGFEYGYSLGNPEALVMWEAQFGDFANGAQIIIDQFLAAGETKWLRSSGLTLLLPHGYEGAGPEHSSARPERFLQLCAENNLRVCMPSTPASFFHLLRRQIARRCRKPLVVFTPKSLLRHRNAVSALQDMGPQTRFLPVLADPLAGKGARRIVLCSGKVYYDLVAEREKRQQEEEVALIRLEQLYPFPHHALVEALKAHPDAEHVVWCQEEPRNGGAWRFVDRRVEHAVKTAGLTNADGTPKRTLYAGRAAGASPATGLASRHQAEQRALVEKALTRDATPTPSYQPETP